MRSTQVLIPHLSRKYSSVPSPPSLSQAGAMDLSWISKPEKPVKGGGCKDLKGVLWGQGCREGHLRAGAHGRPFCAPISTQYLNQSQTPHVFAELKTLGQPDSQDLRYASVTLYWEAHSSWAHICVVSFLPRPLPIVVSPLRSSPVCFIFFS